MSASEACRSEGSGLRLTLLLLSLWLLWGVVFTLIAYWLNRKDCRTFADVSKAACPGKNARKKSTTEEYNTIGKLNWQYSAMPSTAETRNSKTDSKIDI